MRKPITLLFTLVLAASLLTACGGGKKEEVPATSEPGILKVAVVNGNDRFTQNISGAPDGIEAEIAKRVADAGGYAVQFTMTENEEAMINGVANGEYDLGFGRIPDTDTRISGLTVSAGYGRGGLFLVTPKNNYMDCLTLMQTGTLGISVKAEPLKDEVDGAEEIATQSYLNIAEMGPDIVSGTILAGLVNEREALSLISDEVQAQELINSPKETYVALMPAGSPLVDSVNSVIGQYKIDKAAGEE